MKRIMLLGGSFGQLPAIEEAKRRNYYTILCDYLPDNPGQNLADEFHLVSTTDIENVCRLAKKKKIDTIMAFSSDPAAYTAAVVSSKLGLIGNQPESVKLMSRKDLFRKFQEENGFNVPSYKVLTESDIDSMRCSVLDFPVVVKPVDSSDSKGVSLVQDKSELRSAAEIALRYSRCNKMIAEEYIDHKIARLHGDGFVLNGKLEYCELGDQACTSVAAPLKPTTTSFPSLIDPSQMKRVKKTVAEVIRRSGLENGPINIEAKINSHDKVYISEIGPRNGGHLTGHSIYHHSGVDMLAAHFDFLEGNEVHLGKVSSVPTLFYVLFSNNDGVFKDFTLQDGVRYCIAEKRIFKRKGDTVKSFNEPGSDVGALVLTFKTLEYLQQCKDQLPGKISESLLIDYSSEDAV